MSVLPRPTLTAAVEATGVSKRYRHQTVLDGVDLRVDRGVTGLLGPNGAGKTTLLRIISTVLRPDGGDVRIFGLDPADDRQRHDIRCRLGYQPQEPGFFQSFSVLAFLDYVAILKELTDRTERRRGGPPGHRSRRPRFGRPQEDPPALGRHAPPGGIGPGPPAGP